MEKFTVIIIHYNQMNYIGEALLSVLDQNYENIELIVADDHSPTFDSEIVEKFIKEHNKNNYSYKILKSDKNLGTVKNLNKALNEVTGEYILFFAADDKLYDNNVISNFVYSFKDKNKNVITSQCILYDKNLCKIQKNFVNKNYGLKLNKRKCIYLYTKMAMRCIYAAGATAYRKDIFYKYGKFDDKYKYIEDFSYFLKILREGEKMYYENFNTLCHRDGGISHSTYTKDTIPPHVKQYYIDMLNIYENEIFPYFNRFNLINQYKIVSRYQQQFLSYGNFVPELLNKKNILNGLKSNFKKLNLLWKVMFPIRCFRDDVVNRIRCILKIKKTLMITFIMWLLVNIIFVNNLNIQNLNIIMLIYMLDYFVIYIIICILRNILKFITKRKVGGLNV